MSRVRSTSRAAQRQRSLETEYRRELSGRRGLPDECCTWEDDPIEGRMFVVQWFQGGFVARITGADAKYHYARQFLGERRKRPDGGVIWLPVATLLPYDTLELRVNEWRSFCLWTGFGIEPITERDLRRALVSRWRAWVQGRAVTTQRAIIVE